MNPEYNLEKINIFSKEVVAKIAKDVITSYEVRNLSVPKFAEQCGLSEGYIRRWLNGTNSSNPMLKHLLILHHKNVIKLPSYFNREESKNKALSVLCQNENPTDPIDINIFLIRLGEEIDSKMKKKGLVTRSFKAPLNITTGTITKLINSRYGEGSNDIHLETFLKMVLSLEINVSSILAKEYKPIEDKSVNGEDDAIRKRKKTINSNREEILNMILSSKPEVLKMFYSNGFRTINCERQLNLGNGSSRRIDIYGVDEIHNVGVYLEAQINTMDDEHFRQVKSIADTLNEGVIIWAASKVNSRYYKELEDLISGSNKSIKILFVDFDQKFLDELSRLDSMSEMEAYEEIMQTTFVNPIFTVRKELSTMEDSFIGSFEEHNSYSNVLMNKLIPKMREELWAYSSIRSVQIKEGDNSIRLSVGLREIEIQLNLRTDRSMESYIQICSPDKKTALSDFRKIKLRLLDIEFGAPIVEVNERKLLIDYGINNFPKSTSDENIDEFVNIILKDIGKLLHAFSEYRTSLKKSNHLTDDCFFFHFFGSNTIYRKLHLRKFGTAVF
ncbi:hypothetical protein [Sporosarcina aquimarina]|uniref:hypothetical protein n=1 Tax=Sporosarcina aquimarina TaxID=114975 RepID=UPI001C8DE79A|nr:hypothetical protein [Sporosarcina aquimarina]MBY0221783.1 hypothetical protein [Sporosarcina aquimarina]